MTFARHDITAHPPFLRSDILSCRNILIYFQPVVQAKILPVLHYALSPGGLLFIGKSETVSQGDGLFEAVDATARLYRSRGPRWLPTGNLLPLTPAERVVSSPSLSERLAEDHTRFVLERYAPASVLVTRDGTVMHTLGPIGRYLAFPSGRPVLGIAKLVREDARTEIQALLHRAVRENKAVIGRVYADQQGERHRMTVTPVASARTECFLIAFEPVNTEASPLTVDHVDGDTRTTQGLTSEVDALRENLQTVIEELETQNEEMQSLNEELQSANEELQSTNEELETSNEELQSTNEELTTVNDELGQKSKELADANADLLALQESLPFPVLVFDDDLRVSRSNGVAVRIFEMARMSGLTLHELMAAPELESIREAVIHAVSARTSLEGHVTLHGRHYTLIAHPCEIPSRNTSGMMLQLVDVTPLMEARRHLESSQARLGAVLDNSSMSVLMTDIEGVVDYVNTCCLESLNVAPQDVIGKRFWEFFSPADARALRQRHAATVASEASFECEDRIVRAGRTVHLHSVWIPLRNELGAMQGVCWTTLDITAAQETRESLERSEAVSRAVLKGIPTVLAVLDRAGHIVSVNDGWRAFASENGAATDTAWVGESYLDHCGAGQGMPVEAERAREGIRDVLAGRLPGFELEYPCDSPDRKRWFRMIVVPLGNSGGAVVMHLDITTAHETRAALESANAHLDETVAARTQELRQAVDELEMFMHTVSHDLRTPLRTIASFGELVGAELSDTVTDQTRDYLHRMSSAAVRMNHYLDELLKLSHLARGDIMVRPVDLTQMVREIGQDLAARTPDRRVNFEVADGLEVRGDPNLLRGVFENLLSNAWKYTRTRDPARIEVGRVLREDRGAIYVRDNGIGFDMTYRDKLFMPFQRLHTQEEYEGSGLGLAAARRIVVRHGGTIEAEGRPDFGATFYVYLP